MKQRTEYQVVIGDGYDVHGGLTKKQAELEFENNKQATELRKTIFKIADEDWETAGEGEREDITIKERN